MVNQNVSKPIQITRALYDIYKKKLYTTGALDKKLVTEEEFKENLHAILSLYKEFIDAYEEYSWFDITLKPEEEYSESGSFFNDINAKNFYCDWVSCDIDRIDKMVKDGEALCFLITNRNMYTPKIKKNAYAKQFLLAMSDPDSDIVINSYPKIYSRKAAIKRRVTHKEGSFLINKFDTNGKKIPDNVYEELYRYYNDKLLDTDLSAAAKKYIKDKTVVAFKSDKDIIKDKRYTEDKWFINFTVTKNRTVKDTYVTKKLSEIKDGMNIMAVTRSEQDLLYYTVTTPDGKVLESSSLNTIGGRSYWDDLKQIDTLRKKEKSEQWKYDRKVKDIRNGYLSKAISIIAKKALEYQALIVVEYISDEIKDRFSAFDNNVFKSFENQLLNRLADLYFLDVPDGEPGSVSNPYQLCTLKQSDYYGGIVQFVSAAYTGNIDRETGFVNVFDLNGLKTLSAKKAFLSKFDSIRYDEKLNRFRFVFDYSNFRTKYDLMNTQWEVLAGGASVTYNKEYKTLEYKKETASDAVALIEANKHTLKDDYAMLALDGKLSGKETAALYDMFINAVRGIVRQHDGVRKLYVSPITGKEYDQAQYATENLVKKYLWNKDKDKNNWLDEFAEFAK